MLKRILKNILFLFLIFSSTLLAQVSTLGKDFWVGFMEIVPNSTPEQKLYISSQVNTTATINMPLFANWTQTVNILANQITVVTLPTSARTTSVETAVGNAVRITSPDLIGVFASQESSARTEASVVLPIAALGGTTEYYIASYQGVINNSNQNPATGVPARSEFLIVAYEDNTQISITPTANTSTNRPANVPFTVTLNRGQTYQVQSLASPAPSLSNYKPYDLTGTRIVSTSGCKPFAVFSGANATITNSACMAWEHIYEQQFPIHTWGKTYLVAPFKNSNLGYLYRIIASQDNTNVTVNGANVATLNKGEFFEVNNNNNSPNCVNADKPIAVAQYIKGQNCNGIPTQPSGGTSGPVNVGDPAMIMLNPIDQTVKKVTYNTITSSNMLPPNPALYYVSIITKTTNIDKIKLNGTTLTPSNFLPFSCNNGYSYANIDINAGTHNLESDSSFIAYHYGYGRAEGYAYSVGASFENLSRNFNVTPGLSICVGQTINVNGFGTDIISYAWDFGEAGATATGQTSSYTYNTDGVFNIKMTVATQGGCGSDNVIKQIEVLPYPVVNLGADRIICPRDSVELDAGDFSAQGPVTYTWSNGKTTRKIWVKQAGNYSVFVKNRANCQSNTASVNVTFYPDVLVNITNVNDNICIDTPVFNLAATPAGGTFHINNIEATQLNASTLGVGNHRVIYTYQNPANGCINKDTVNFSIKPLPIVSINNLNNMYCVNVPSFSLQGTPAGTGGVFTIDGNIVTELNPAGLGVGIKNVVYTFTDNFGCVNSTAKNIEIKPLPVLSFNNLLTDYCVDAPIVQLSANPTGGRFEWVSTNTQTTRIKPDSLGVGNYDLRYIYTDTFGCTNQITQTINIHPLPTPQITGLRAIYCSNHPAFALTATPAGGVFTINGVVNTQFDALALGVGTFTIVYTYTDAKGCVKSTSEIVNIEAPPTISITGLQFVYCINSNSFDLTANPKPQGEGGTGIFTINGTIATEVKPNILGAGVHTVVYTFIDDRTQCIQTDTKTLEISNLPAVALVNIAGIKDKYCLNETAVNLMGAGTPAGGTFSIDGITKTELNPSDPDVGVGIHTLMYNYRDVNNCVNVASRTFEVLPLPPTTITNLMSNYCIQVGGFQMNGTPAGGTFTINGNLSNNIFNPNALGLGSHVVTYTEPKGCVTFTKEVVVRAPLPPPTIINPKICSNSGNYLLLDAGEAKEYVWSNNQTTRTIRIFQAGIYSVTITDSLDCKTTASFEVKEDCTPQIFVPTAFSPNGDNLNDNFEVFGQDVIAFEMKIFNRWGECVYVSYDYRAKWDGTYNGIPCQAGTYIVDIKYKELPARVQRSFRSTLTIVK
jgi:gliding motility-associated-like protein